MAADVSYLISRVAADGTQGTWEHEAGLLGEWRPMARRERGNTERAS